MKTFQFKSDFESSAKIYELELITDRGLQGSLLFVKKEDAIRQGKLSILNNDKVESKELWGTIYSYKVTERMLING